MAPSPWDSIPSADQQAILLFEDYLTSLEEGTALPWEEFLRQNAEHAELLRSMRRGLQRFDAFVASESDASSTEPAEEDGASVLRLRPWVVVAASVALVIAGLAAFLHTRSISSKTQDGLAMMLASIDHRIEDATNEILKGNLRDRKGDNVTELAFWTQRAMEIEERLDEGFRVQPDVLQHARTFEESRAASFLAVRSMEEPEPWQKLEHALEQPVSTPELETEFLYIAGLARLGDAVHEVLEVDVFDLDDDWRTVEAQVHAQEINVFTGDFLPSRFLGLSSSPVVLPVGDWRITAIDPETGRFSQRRLGIKPGAASARPYAMFLRAHPRKEENMAALQGGSFRFEASGLGEWDATCEPFRMDRFETSVQDYIEFVADLTAHADRFPEAPVTTPEAALNVAQVADDVLDHAIGGITWRDAELMANWSGKRLPTEREWQWAAQGSQQRAFPWGPVFDLDRVESQPPGVTMDDLMLMSQHPGPIRFPNGATPDGIERMADNASEWVEDMYMSSSSVKGLLRIPAGSDGRSFLRLLKGGHIFSRGIDAYRPHQRQHRAEEVHADRGGFRGVRPDRSGIDEH